MKVFLGNMKTIITNKPIDIIKLEATLNDPACGGVVTFSGKVRNHHEGRSVERLSYEAFIPMAQKELEKITDEAMQRFGVAQVQIVHRVGELAIGDVAVWIGVQSPHRAEAFAACQYAIDELKTRAPIWKKEFYADATSDWVNCHHVATKQPVKQAVILAGGKSERFGRDKIFAEIDDKPMIKILIENLQQCGFEVLLSGAATKLQTLGLKTIEDDSPFDGPLAALATILQNIKVDKILVLAADMPFITPAILSELWQMGSDVDIAILEGSWGRSPLPGVYSRKLQKNILDLMQQGRRDLMALWEQPLHLKTLNKITLQTLDPEEKSLVNINTQNDLAKI